MMKLIAKLVSLLLICVSFASKAELQVGAERFDQYLPLLKGKRVGLLVNQTSRVKEQHLVDALLEKGINIKFIFAPEHGFRGNHDAGAHVKSSVDAKTGIPVVSIYGKHKKPAKALMEQIDIVIFDIQDVGVRFYTYISSMHYMMEAAAENNVSFLVLDRPNPNIAYVDGPVLDPEFKSFVGMHPIPILHGMTVAELAKMINAEGWLKDQNKVDLHVVKVADYNRQTSYDLPVKPSPNLPNSQAIQLYPSLCFFEPTAMSIGRGTPTPFQVLGHDSIHLGEYQFTPVSTPGAALNPKLKDVVLKGLDLTNSTIKGLDLSLIVKAQKAFKDNVLALFTSPSFMDKLAGTDQIRLDLLDGKSEAEIKAKWQQGLSEFKQQRRPYLLYK